MAQEHEKKIDDILLSLPDNRRLFKSRAGFGWQGKSTRKGQFTIIKNAAAFKGMPDGWPDLTGWTEIEITPDMVGRRVAVFTACEIKTGGQSLKPEQKRFRDIIERMGGIYEILSD
jgi:hypothetical protein